MAAARDEEKKRAPPEDEAEAEVHQAFRRSANALSHLYAQSVASQKASFHAGERRAMDEIERRGGMAGSPQHPSPQPANGSPAADVQTSTFSFGNVAAALGSQQWQTDQARTAGIPDALPSPSQQNIHPYHPVQCSGYGPVDSPPSNHSPPDQESVQGDASEHQCISYRYTLSSLLSWAL